MDAEIKKIKQNMKNKKKEVKTNKTLITHVNKFLFVVLLTVITLILLKSNTSFKTKFYKYVFEDNISFASINNLYQKYFGSVIPFSDLIESKVEATFEEQLNYQQKEKYLDGVLLTVSSNYLVPSLETGMVIFVGEKEGYGNTVIIEQVNGVEVWYSNITSSVKIYDYIEKGTLVGEANDKIYMVFKKDGEVLNYEDYI